MKKKDSQARVLRLTLGDHPIDKWAWERLSLLRTVGGYSLAQILREALLEYLTRLEKEGHFKRLEEIQAIAQRKDS